MVSSVLEVRLSPANFDRHQRSFIASHNPAHILFSGRNKARADDLISKIAQASPSTKVTFVECDLASLTSVQSAAKQILSSTDRLDVLMCNAGIMAVPNSMSKDGYEIQFATNHLGHALQPLGQGVGRIGDGATIPLMAREINSPSISPEATLPSTRPRWSSVARSPAK